MQKGGKKLKEVFFSFVFWGGGGQWILVHFLPWRRSMGRWEEALPLTLSEERKSQQLVFQISICLQVWEDYESIGKNTVVWEGEEDE